MVDRPHMPGTIHVDILWNGTSTFPTAFSSIRLDRPHEGLPIPHATMRVIIVGSGLSGLVLGHCLVQAGINDFVILERRPDAAERSGSVIGFFPQTFRILDQLDLLDDIQKLCPPLHHWLHLNPQVRTIYTGGQRGFFDFLQTNHGHASRGFMRRDLMEILYSKLPHRERHVLPNKKVTGVEQDESSVTVTCSDGSVFKGDVLVGCDGVHSAVQRYALEQPRGESKPPPRAEYRGLFGSSPLPDGIAPCGITETHDRGIVFMILCSQDTAFWFVTHLKDKNAPGSQKYSSEDIQALVDEYENHSVAPGGKVTFGDLWRTRKLIPGPGMYDLHESVAERWYNGRVVIVGDAAHKMTPNLGQGGNNAIESVASLVNRLNALAKEKPIPTAAELEAAFGLYQNEREAQVKFIAGLAGSYTRWTSWRNWFGWFMQFWMWPLAGDRLVVNRLLSPLIKDSIKLDFVQEKHLPAGKVPWKFP
ncbi:FAD/NAD(P)-binding domain-containing protein [Parathielavia hyrcaniae]|uniref:FAD/NAD(P)-binding domain-containing protein n=1 Tax=Parathielavia hyrcaniae TaxID=113614 RepID=A0AAN6SYR2_9PEZI|nr:FAD/NAD(P)-binding domain-containing protein [Parathielavia hyrcaniae]